MPTLQDRHYARLLAALGLPEDALTDDERRLVAWLADWGSTSERVAALIARAAR